MHPPEADPYDTALCGYCPSILQGNDFIMMLHADFFAEVFGPFDFVVAFTIVKPYSKRFLAAEIGGYIAGIHTAGKEAAYLYIADLMSADGFLKYFGNLVRAISESWIHPAQIWAPNSDEFPPCRF